MKITNSTLYCLAIFLVVSTSSILTSQKRTRKKRIYYSENCLTGKYAFINYKKIKKEPTNLKKNYDQQTYKNTTKYITDNYEEIRNEIDNVTDITLKRIGDFLNEGCKTQ